MSYEQLAASVDALKLANDALTETVLAGQGSVEARDAAEAFAIESLTSANQSQSFAIQSKQAAIVSGNVAQTKVDAAMAELALPEGSESIGFIQEGSGSTALSSKVKMGERMSITDKGAVPGVDCAAAIVSAIASTSWDIYVPRGAFTATVTSANAAAIFSALNRIKIDGSLTLNIASGAINLSSQVVINSPDANKISIVGASVVSTTLVSQVSVTGAAKGYSVVVQVVSSTGVAVGDYAIIRTDVAGTGDFYCHSGVWKVTAVNEGGANTLTLLNTHHGAAFPTNTVTGGSVRILKTILKWTGSDGFRFEGGQSIGLIDNVAIVGDWDLSAATGTVGCHGIVMASPNVVAGASSNAVFNMAGNASLGVNVGISSWGEQGIAISGRCGLVANFVTSCSNRKRGWYAEGGHIRAKFGVGSGNGEDGYISDTTGFIQAALCIASGNGLNGFWNTNNGLIAAATSIASGNLGHGYECRGLGRIGADFAKSINNVGAGFLANDGGMIDADSGLASGNGAHGFDAGSNGTIDCDNSTSTGNTGNGYRSQYNSTVRASGCTVSGNTGNNYYARDGGVLIESGGTTTVQDVSTYSVSLRSYNSAKTSYYGLSTTSIGDLVFSAGTTSKIVMKTDGTIHPSTDGGSPLGRTTEKFSQLNCIVGLFSGPVKCGQYTLSTLPSASTYSGYEIDVTDATGGPKRCRSNGSVWQILNTTTTVS